MSKNQAKRVCRLVNAKNLQCLAAVLLGLSMLYFIPVMPYAQAETVNVYVEKMPKHWQEKFGGVLDDATKYWEAKIPGLQFNTVQYSDKSDFVVQWASQYGEGKLGYYSTDTTNVYGKPMVGVTLGFFKDKQWTLVPAEYVLQVTKHEIGRAIGIPYSQDPDDIMYPTVEDHESWQQHLEPQASHMPATGTDLQAESDAYQKLAAEKIMQIDTELLQIKSTLNSLVYDNKAGKHSLNESWKSFWWAKKYLHDAEKAYAEGVASSVLSDYEASYHNYKTSYDYATKSEQKVHRALQEADNVNRLTSGGT